MLRKRQVNNFFSSFGIFFFFQNLHLPNGCSIIDTEEFKGNLGRQ